MGVDAAAAAVVPETEFTVEVAAVGGVDIQVFPVLVGDGKAFFDTAEKYDALCHPVQTGAYEAMKSFAKELRQYVPTVTNQP